MRDNANGRSPAFQHWELAVDSLSDLLLLVDDHGRILRGNRALERWGLAPVLQAPGQHIHPLLHGGCEDRSCYLRDFVSRLDAHRGSNRRVETEREDRLLGRWVHLTIESLAEMPWRGESSGAEKPAFLVTARDTTEIHRQRVRDGRRARFETHHHLARGLAHEINNPLAAMRTTVEVLAENFARFDADKVAAYLRTVLEGTERLQAILDRALSAQRFPTLDLQAMPIGRLLERVRSVYESELAARGVGLRVAIPEQLGPVVEIDLLAAEEVLANVIRSAAEATPAGGVVTVGSLAGAEAVEVTVRDSGSGADSLQLDSLSPPIAAGMPRGVGIGLAYSNYLMSRMSGSMVIDSHLGLGTSVTLYFSRERERAPKTTDGEPGSNPDR